MILYLIMSCGLCSRLALDRLVFCGKMELSIILVSAVSVLF